MVDQLLSRGNIVFITEVCRVSNDVYCNQSYLIIHVVFVDVVLVKDQFEELPHGVHVHRLQLPGFAARLLVVTERDVAESSEPLGLVRREILGQAVADVELDLAGNQVLVSQQLQLPDATPLHHLKDDFLWELAKPWRPPPADGRGVDHQFPGTEAVLVSRRADDHESDFVGHAVHRVQELRN